MKAFIGIVYGGLIVYGFASLLLVLFVEHEEPEWPPDPPPPPIEYAMKGDWK
jgi:hypothetical protein